MLFGLLKIWVWFIVPESKLSSYPSNFVSLLRDCIFILVHLNRIQKAKIKGLTTICIVLHPMHQLRIVLLISTPGTPYMNCWAGNGRVTLASCPHVFLDQLKSFSKKLPRDATHLIPFLHMSLWSMTVASNADSYMNLRILTHWHI